MNPTDTKAFLWAKYDPHDDFIYPNINHWDELLIKTIEMNAYGTLTKDEALSILFGLCHRDRIIEGLWRSMFESNVTQQLLKQLQGFDIDPPQ